LLKFANLLVFHCQLGIVEPAKLLTQRLQIGDVAPANLLDQLIYFDRRLVLAGVCADLIELLRGVFWFHSTFLPVSRYLHDLRNWRACGMCRGTKPA